MYRDGDIIAVYTLDRPGHGSLAGCADACLLNWRMTADTTQALDTDCSVESHCPMASGILVADRKCEAFMFNRQTGVCTLLSAERSMRLTRSSNFWSGKVICEDMSSVDDWAEGVVSRRSPPPPSLFYLDSNGVTVKCPFASVGDTGDVGGVTYTKRTRTQIDALINSADYAALSATCTSGITDMSSMFLGAQSFNHTISSWDTSSVTTMRKMFERASIFNQDIGDWSTSSVTDMNQMFDSAYAFNQDLNKWDTSSVKTMYNMFYSTANFNGNINDWDISSVTFMFGMFSNSAFNQPVNKWDTSSVENMQIMFQGAANFNQDINDWNTSSVTNMFRMFTDAQNFNGNIREWDTSSVQTMLGMFGGATSFNQDISSWDGSSLADGQCTDFALGATAWLAAYNGTIATTPPISPSMIAAGCGP